MVSVRTWLVVDAVLDNVISTQLQSGGGDDVVRRAQALRERGWDLAAVHPLRGQGPVGWPPLDAVFGIELDDADLAFVGDRVDAAAVVTGQILASDRLPPTVRAEQEQSLTDLERARTELSHSPESSS
ncbi:hypothetical protein AB1K54_04700 [Microbacterium sp. BWT-B31]|uniref:hypothetical protein n=1 Tax=Microbacterium sp. BWT-B31 TaxID=3232072 RepID=UPI00352797A9